MGVLSYAFFAQFAKNYSQSYNGFHQSEQTTDAQRLPEPLRHPAVPRTGFLLFSLNRAITRTDFVRAIFFGQARRRSAGRLSAGDGGADRSPAGSRSGPGRSSAGA